MCRHDPAPTILRARSRRVWAGDGMAAHLRHYPPALVQPKHDHDRAHLSFLLTGSFAERGDTGEATPIGGRHSFKPQGAYHAVDFGRQGALILSIEFGEVPVGLQATKGWRPSARSAAAQARLILDGVADPADAVASLLGSIAPAGTATPTSAPLWLRRSVDHLMGDPTADISAVAADAGVHRVHLARACQRHFGLSPTHIRLHAKLNRALHLMIDQGARPCEAALAAGFADQAHWSRASRAMAGISPVRLRALLAA